MPNFCGELMYEPIATIIVRCEFILNLLQDSLVHSVLYWAICDAILNNSERIKINALLLNELVFAH
jgi:hypothetical protein